MSNSPGYGEKPPLQGGRRSFTAPPRQLSFHERAALDKSDAGSGLIYQHPAVRIISFEPPKESIVSKSNETHADADYPIDTIETLPWRSRTEDLAAAGPMRIEKVQGSVNFLKCGHNFVHSILRNSQCWCVDGESKFVLRKGKLQYYRLELPGETAEDKVRVEELKTALKTILKYEKTPCPFKRAFSVDLPEDAITPRRKGKWKAKEPTLLSSPDPSTPTVRKWKSSRPSMPYTPPTSFPDSFNKRRTSDFNVDSPTIPRPSPLQRRSSVAERAAAFEKLQSSSRPSSRPQTPASSTSSVSLEEQDLSDRESSAADDQLLPQLEEREDAPGSEKEADDFSGSTSSIHEDENVLEPERSSKQEQLQVMPAVQEHSVEALEAPIPESEPADTILDDDQDDSVLHHEIEISPDVRPEFAETHPPVAEVKLPVTETDHNSEKDETEPGPVIEIEDLSAESVQQAEDSAREEDMLDISKINDELTSPTDELASLGEADDDEDDAQSVASTADSFHTTDSARDQPADEEPTLTAEAFKQLEAKQPSHKRDISEITVTASSFSGGNNDDELPLGTPRLLQSSMSDESWPDVQTPSIADQEGLRQRTKGPPQRSLSPLPASSNIISSIPNQESTTKFTAAIIQKAATMAITKPVEVVVLVIHVLARIAGGATLNDLLNGGLFQRPQRTRRHTRNPSFPDRVVVHSDDDDDYEDEDDFGVPIRGRVRRSGGGGVESAKSQKGGRPAAILEEDEGEGEAAKDVSDVDSMFADDLD